MVLKYLLQIVCGEEKEYLLSEDGKMVIEDKNFFEVDLRDHKSCLKVTEGMDIVVHLADVVAGIKYVFANEVSLFRSNILINSNTLDACVSNNVKKYIYAENSLFISKIKTNEN